MDDFDLGIFIKDHRKKAGLTQLELADWRFVQAKRAGILTEFAANDYQFEYDEYCHLAKLSSLHVKKN